MELHFKDIKTTTSIKCSTNRAQQELDYMNGEPVRPALVEELHALRYHKSDLEEKLYCLQDSRRHLMGQMETLMKLLKVNIIAKKQT